MFGARTARRQVAATSIFVVIALAAAPTVARASSYQQQQSELQTLIQQKEGRLRSLNHQANDLFSQLKSTDEQLATIQRHVDSLSAQLADARARLAQLDNQLNNVSAELTDKTAEMETALARLQTQQKAMNQRVTDIYINAPTGYDEALNVAQDFADLVTANQYAGSVIRADSNVVKQLQQTEALIEAQRNDIASKQSNIVTTRNAAAAEAQHIADLQSQQASARDLMASVQHHQGHLLTLVNRQRNSYIAAIKELQRENNLLSALIRGYQKGQRVIQGVGGYLKWPVSGPITSPFGWRIHPIYGYRSFHTGIDIGVPTGTIVKAARHGRVIYTGYNGAFGLVVIIDHGNSLATMYAHLSRVFVRVGENVGTLESIAASGSTGWSTGPHLHFQVDLQGTPVNPLSWL
ncbi:MAG: murein hydrolase activator EnvC family protein [Actinomycetota bacterium]